MIFKRNMSASLIYYFLMGFELQHTAKGSLRKLRYTHTLEYYMFVLPMAYLVVTEMNPDYQFTLEDLLKVDISQFERTVNEKIEGWGIWSIEWIHRRVMNPGNPNLCIRTTDTDLCRGLCWELAKIEKLIHSYMKAPEDRLFFVPFPQQADYGRDLSPTLTKKWRSNNIDLVL